jgi:hypothetical protein
MDTKSFAGVLIVVGLAALIIATAQAGTLAWIDVALVGLLYGIRRRRITVEAMRYSRAA